MIWEQIFVAFDTETTVPPPAVDWTVLRSKGLQVTNHFKRGYFHVKNSQRIVEATELAEGFRATGQRNLDSMIGLPTNYLIQVQNPRLNKPLYFHIK